ncbi:MAG TPA: ribose-5-phosphate isomerase A, partial [Methanobacterium sp.]|nr:ribose-5-phosphate isomerase A [Methanobacterium sp.]
LIPSSIRTVTRRLEAMGGKPVLRMAERKDGPVITDNGNFVADVDFGLIHEPVELEKEINHIPGVIENGLFTDIVHEVLVGTDNGLDILKK